MVKRSLGRRSAPGTPSARTFEISVRSLAGLASSTAITLPVATVALHHQSVVLVLLTGLVPALPMLLITVVLMLGYTAAVFMAIVVTASSIVGRRDNSAQCIDRYLAWITNPVISLMTGTLLNPPKLETRAHVQKDMPQSLPVGVSGNTRNQGEIALQTSDHPMAA